jgi:hypothetical protein
LREIAVEATAPVGSCQTAAVSFHESFWVAVAAAAPIIALANQVTVTDSLGMQRTFESVLARNPSDIIRKVAKQGIKATRNAYWVAYTNLFAQATMLIFALSSLQFGNDLFSLPASVSVEAIGLALILATSIFSGTVRASRAALERDQAELEKVESRDRWLAYQYELEKIALATSRRGRGGWRIYTRIGNSAKLNREPLDGENTVKD